MGARSIGWAKTEKGRKFMMSWNMKEEMAPGRNLVFILVLTILFKFIIRHV